MPCHSSDRTANIAVGTYKLQGDAAMAAVRMALEHGVRHIDTAQLYHNSRHVFEAITAFEKEQVHDATKPSETVAVTTKVSKQMPPSRTVALLRKYSAMLSGRPIDTLLLHRPMPLSSWEGLNQCVRHGLVREIGVSNYTIEQLQALLAACDVADMLRPVVNQVEFHPFVENLHELLSFCRSHGIRVQGHTMLAQGLFFDYPPLRRLACDTYHVSPPVLMLRWAHQLGVELLVGCTNSAHLEDILTNVYAMRDITESDIAAMSSYHV
jgi:diketogulonate reductase-like aldo/keto reductase